MFKRMTSGGYPWDCKLQMGMRDLNQSGLKLAHNAGQTC